MCQTSYVNGIDGMCFPLPCTCDGTPLTFSTTDFCLWSSPKANETIADTEGETVAYCSKPGHGTRLFPAGALQGVQYMITPAYRQVVGFIDQSMIDLQPDDFGGELDPHGADLVSLPTSPQPYVSPTHPCSFSVVIPWVAYCSRTTSLAMANTPRLLNGTTSWAAAPFA